LPCGATCKPPRRGREKTTSDGSFHLKPFREYRPNLVVEALMDVSPHVTSLAGTRKGIRDAVSRLRSMTLGIVGREDVPKISDGLSVLQVEAEYALLVAIAIIGHSTSSLKDLLEYNAFSAITLPERGSKPPECVLWNDGVNVAVSRHYDAMALLRQATKSAPRYRKQGHDYCQDMLEMCIRCIMRPGIVVFTRLLERKLGWPSVEKSGVLSHINRVPNIDSTGGVQ